MRPLRIFEDDDLSRFVSWQIADGKVVGWFQGRMEFGPRALGNRSILADPRNPGMQKLINVKIKGREQFRPFVPTVLVEDADQYFETRLESKYMLFIEFLKDDLRKKQPANDQGSSRDDRLYDLRSDLQPVTHIDYSAS